MGLRFRRSISLGKGARINLNKDSIGLSFGVRGARVSANSKGRKTATVGIPGSGLSYTKNIGNKSKKTKTKI